MTDRLNAYFAKVLHLDIDLQPWEDEGRLPLFLRDDYAFFCAEILNHACLFMVDRNSQQRSPATIRKHMDRVESRWSGAVIYVRDGMTSYNRDRLIRGAVPFVVPGNQMYLPMLAIDLREHFRAARRVPAIFSPATQVVFLHMLYTGSDGHWTPTMLAEELGYTAMSMSRAFDQLESARIADVSRQGRRRVLTLGEAPKAAWDAAQQQLRSPVARRVYVPADEMAWPEELLAGESALAEHSMLAPPRRPAVAMDAKRWKRLQETRPLYALDEWDSEAVVVELWSYPPNQFGSDRAVDKLSLWLSLRGTDDERVEGALEEMLEGIAW